jgi:hypothetical protein
MLKFESFLARGSGCLDHFGSGGFQELQSKTTDRNVAIAFQLAKHSLHLVLLGV